MLVMEWASTALAGFAIRRQRPRQARAWWLLWSTMLLASVANLAWGLQALLHLPPPPSPLMFDSLYLVAYVCGTVGLFKVVGRSDARTSWEALLDAIILAVGLAIPTWSFLVNPMLDTSGFAARLLYPVGDLVMVTMTARLWFTAGKRTPSTVLLVVAQIGILAFDVLTWSSALSNVTPQFIAAANLGWIFWYSLCTASVLHPSVKGTIASASAAKSPEARHGGADAGSGAADANRRSTKHGRFLLLLVLSVLGPAVTAFEHSFVTPILSGLLAVILVIRMQFVTRVAQTRADALDVALFEQRTLQAQLSHRALHDPLTGLGNRALLNERLSSTLDGPVALLLLDLDGFKDVNDTYGHPAGDELLVQVADRLRGVLSIHDTLVRLGGDEFAILLRDMSTAWPVAQRALDALRKPYQHDLYLTTSIGLLVSETPMAPADALRDVDLALYGAKEAGKNQIVQFDQALRDARLDHARLTEGLHRALANGEFALQYQPVMDLTSGEMYAVEALLRWNPPGRPTVPPDEFIPAAEEIGLIVPIGTWVLERALRDAAPWHRTHGIAVNVNVSGRQLRDRTFVDVVRHSLEASGLPARALVLEITETVLVTAATADAETVVGQLKALRAMGVRVAIDDFGTGYSSLSYLRDLPVDVLKIDRSFTSTGGDDLTFTRAILELSTTLSLQTVAEGVETLEQAEQLAAMNCPLAQGFHFSRPVNAAGVFALLGGNPWETSLTTGDGDPMRSQRRLIGRET
jgi:diguanylate cyclase (GGDEF)-like protein